MDDSNDIYPVDQDSRFYVAKILYINEKNEIHAWPYMHFTNLELL
jgi:hypothetical protein